MNASSGELSLTLRWHTSLAEVPRQDWDGLALAHATPFLEWDWLSLLEESGSVGREQGWQPCHLSVRMGSGPDARLVAAAPLYVKTHSEGEFVWDYAWAELAERLQVPYYPKLVGMTPFTPAGAYRFLMAPELGQAEEARLTALMLEAMEGLCAKLELCSIQFNYVDPAWRPLLAEHGFETWLHQSYTWQNVEYADFDDFLGAFRTGQRKNIRKERARLIESGVQVSALPGEQTPTRLYGLMHDYYERTNQLYGPWGCKYLTREFFAALPERFAHRLLFTAAREAGRPEGADPVGMAMLMHKNGQLWGRYWGCRREVPYLHFETCYYTPIQWAIAHGLAGFDPGIGTRHKSRRGFWAVPNVSLHRPRHPLLQRIMASHMGAINAAELEHMEMLNADVPFKAEAQRQPLRVWRAEYPDPPPSLG